MKIASAVLVCLSLLGTPALQAQTSAAHVNNAVIGMPIYTADGVKVGQITNIGKYRGKKSMIGEVGSALGFGARQVLIPNDLATIQKDRVVLTITSERVSEMLEANK